MKGILALSILFFGSLSTFSQSKPNLSELSSQINKLISDTSNNFLVFRGALKESQGDTIYLSTLKLTGTLTTEIHVNNDSSFFSAYLDTMVTEKEASVLIVKWKNYLKKILPQNYRSESFSLNTSSINSSGYSFSYNKVKITVFYTHFSSIIYEFKDDKSYFVNLLIANK